jgi:polar amino acid transport system substrate-binding protein
VPYAEAPGADGTSQKHVMLVRMGENRFLVALEEFLLDSGGGG